MFRKSIRMTEKLGTKQILYRESDYIDLPERAARAKELTGTMREYVL